MSAQLMHKPITVVGAGPAGTLMALLLAQNTKLAVTLLDAAQPPEAPDLTEPRVFALSPASLQLLKVVGAYEHLIRYQSYSGMRVWHSGAGSIELGSAKTDSAYVEGAAQDTPMGIMVEPQVLSYALYQAVLAHPNLELMHGRRLKSLRGLEGAGQLNASRRSYRLDFEEGESFETAAVIGSDGRGSKVRTQLGVATRTLNYGQNALSFCAGSEKPHDQIARQVFGSNSVLALLPMQSSGAKPRVSVVWSLPAERADELLALAHSDTRQFNRLLSTASQYELGRLELSGEAALFPLSAMIANQITAASAALIADAAHGVHPLAGQGLNLGFTDAAVLSDTLLAEFERSEGALLASSRALYDYESKQKLHSELAMHAFSAINWGFADHQNPAGHALSAIRSSGISRWGRSSLASRIGSEASGLRQLAQTRWG